MPVRHTIPDVGLLIRFPNGRPALLVMRFADETDVQTLIAKGAVVLESSGPLLKQAIPKQLTNAETEFLTRKIGPHLLRSLRAFDISDEAVKRFKADNNAMDELVEQCGISRKDLLHLTESRKRLETFSPANHVQRRAKRRLLGFLFPKPLKEERGRPVRITAEDRRRIHIEAARLRRAGKNKEEILQALTADYCLEPSYLLRIMEDANVEKS